jgi:hypothetical protein
VSKPRIRSNIKAPRRPIEKTKTRTLKEALVDRHLASRVAEDREESALVLKRQNDAVEAIVRFFNLTESERTEVKLFEFGSDIGCELRGLALVPFGSGFTYLGKCMYCGEETASLAVFSNMVDLGRLIYEDSETGIAPDVQHVRGCKLAPPEKKIAVGVPASPAEELIALLRKVLGS